MLYLVNETGEQGTRGNRGEQQQEQQQEQRQEQEQRGTAPTGATTPQKKAKKINRSAQKNNFRHRIATRLGTGHTRVKRLITQHPNISDKNLYLC